MAEINDDVIERLIEGIESQSGAVKILADSIKDQVAEQKKIFDKKRKDKKNTVLSGSNFDELSESLNDLEDDIDHYISIHEKGSKVLTQFNNHISSVTQAFKGYASDIMANSTTISGFGAFIDPITDIMKSLTDVIGSSIEMFFDLGKSIPILGSALSGIGSAAGSLVKGVGKISADILNFGMKLTLDGISQMWEMFSEVTSAGVVLAGGMNEQQRLREQMGINTKEFSNIVKNSGESLTMFGGSLTKGLRELTKVTSMNKDHRQGLMELGYSYEDQIDLTADYMATLQKSGHLQKTNAADIAAQSVEYMKSLKVISALTGKSAMELKKEQDARLENVAVQLALTKMGPDMMNQYKIMTSGLPESFKKSFAQLLLNVPVDDPAIIQSGIIAPLRTMMAGLKEGLKGDDLRIALTESIRDKSEGIIGNISQMSNVAVGALQGVGGITTSMSATFSDILTFTRGTENFVKSTTDAIKIISTDNKDSSNELIGIMNKQRAVQEQMLEMAQKMMPGATVAMGLITDVTLKASELFNDVIDAMSGKEGAKEKLENAISAMMPESLVSASSDVTAGFDSLTKLGKTLGGGFFDLTEKVSKAAKSFSDKMFGTEKTDTQAASVTGATYLGALFGNNSSETAIAQTDSAELRDKLLKNELGAEAVRNALSELQDEVDSTSKSIASNIAERNRLVGIADRNGANPALAESFKKKHNDEISHLDKLRKIFIADMELLRKEMPEAQGRTNTQDEVERKKIEGRLKNRPLTENITDQLNREALGKRMQTATTPNEQSLLVAAIIRLQVAIDNNSSMTDVGNRTLRQIDANTQPN